MSTEFRRIEELFHAALAVDEAEREAFVHEEARGDETLAREVQDLLHTSLAEGARLEEAVDARQGRLSEELEALGRELGPPPPEQVGSWKLGRRLGVGGMGEVYYATREHGGVEQRAAVKLIRPGPMSRELVRRFTIERQVLAQLDHPYTARFLDAGATEDGLPWFAMEYVEGRPIDVWCDESRRTVGERLQLFRNVCEAVQYSHANLIVHRDIKPSNVLVLADGSPRLLDFGIAKVLDDRGADAGERTRTGALFFSPEYASPEHILGQSVTTASDVYSLGVLLFQLLTGHRPYSRTTHSTFELERAICEDEPARASAIVLEAASRGASHRGPEDVAGRRGSRPDRLSRALRGDLDTVLAKALAKEPRDRYPSVEALSEDVGRHLAGLPILARKRTLAYRATKFVRRHRAACAVAVAIVAIAVHAQVQSRNARVQSRRAQQAEVASRAISDAMVQMLDMLDTAGFRRWTNEEQRAQVATFEAAVESWPRDDAYKVRYLYQAVAAWGAVGDMERAAALVDRVFELATRVLNTDDPLRLDIQVATAMRSLYRFGSPDQALDLLRTTLEATPAEDFQRKEGIWRALSKVHLGQKDYAAVETVLREWELEVDRHPSNKEARIRVVRQLASYHQWTRRDGEAARPYIVELERLCRADPGLSEREELVGATHPVIVDAAVHWQDLGEFERAISCYDLGLRVMERLYPEDHPAVLRDRCEYALLLKDAWLDGGGDSSYPERAETIARDALDRFVATLGPDHPQVGEARHALAKVLMDVGQPAGAEAEILEAIRVLSESSVGAQRSEILVTSWTLLGRIRISLDRPQEALDALLEAEPHQVERLAGHDWELAKTRSLIGAAWSMLGEAERGKQLLVDNHPLIEAGRGARHYRTRDSLERVVAHFERHGPEEELEAWRAKLAQARELDEAGSADRRSQ